MKIKHFILTRFNVSAGSVGKNLCKNWLDLRIQLFERYTLPSIYAQTNKNFEWWIYCDDETPKIYRDTLADCRTVCPQITVWFPRKFSVAGIAAAIRERCGEGTTALTTRLDTDDAVADDFVARLQAAAKPQREFLNFPKGVAILGREYCVRKHESNEFLSFTEPYGADKPVETVHASQHWKAAAVAPVRQLKTGLGWAKVIHGGNVGYVVDDSDTNWRPLGTLPKTFAAIV